MRFLILSTLLAGCSLYPGSGHSDDVCIQNETGVAADQLVNPVNLQCENFSFTSCDPTCGPCPELAQPAPPSWGACQSECTGLDETTCEATATCRVARNYDIYYNGGTNSFMGCFQVDQQTPTTAACRDLDAQTCSDHPECAGLYQVPLCNSIGCDIPAYQACIPEHQARGSCTGPVLCDLAIECPTGTTPGIANGCYTGSCIPDSFCPPSA
jgi:hypothetical protein